MNFLRQHRIAPHPPTPLPKGERGAVQNIVMDAPFPILFEDNHCLVVAKPAPLLTQGAPGVPNLEAMAKDYLRTKYGKKGNVYLGIPHRLDRPVSGVVLFARNSKAADRLAEQFRERTVKKVYWGAVEGSPDAEAGTWED